MSTVISPPPRLEARVTTELHTHSCIHSTPINGFHARICNCHNVQLSNDKWDNATVIESQRRRKRWYTNSLVIFCTFTRLYIHQRLDNCTVICIWIVQTITSHASDVRILRTAWRTNETVKQKVRKILLRPRHFWRFTIIACRAHELYCHYGFTVYETAISQMHNLEADNSDGFHRHIELRLEYICDQLHLRTSQCSSTNHTERFTVSSTSQNGIHVTGRNRLHSLSAYIISAKSTWKCVDYLVELNPVFRGL